MRAYRCSRCDASAEVADTQPGTPMHPCSRLAGMVVPLGPADQSSKVELIAREDYVGREDVRRDDDGRVWMAARVTTDDTEHLTVYAPTAHATIG